MTLDHMSAFCAARTAQLQTGEPGIDVATNAVPATLPAYIRALSWRGVRSQ